MNDSFSVSVELLAAIHILCESDRHALRERIDAWYVARLLVVPSQPPEALFVESLGRQVPIAWMQRHISSIAPR